MSREGFKMTEIGALPEEWEIKTIDDIAETSSGGTPSRDKKEYFIGSIPWVKSGELKDNTIYDTEERITEKGLQNSSAKLFSKGTLLIALYGATVGKTGILGIDATTNQAVCAILIKKDLIDQKFLQYFLISRRKQLISISTGGAQPNISQEIIRVFKIPLPPLPEQRRIAEVLGTVDSAIQKVGGAIESTERLKKGMMQRLLTRGIGHERFKESEVGRVPEEWEVVQVGDITDEHKQGFYTSENYSEEGINLVRITDLQNPEISYLKMPKIKIDDELFKQFKVDVGDFLIARSGAIGRYGIVKSSIPCVFASYIIRFRFDSCRVDNLYFGKLFESFYISNELKKITQGATNKNINAYNIKKIKIPLPLLPEQRRIAEILSAADRKLELERRRKDKLERVKKGLMNELLTGRKRIKVENDGNIYK